MSNAAVSALTALTGANAAAADLLYIVDVSAGASGSKKITREEFFKNAPSLIASVGGAATAAALAFPLSGSYSVGVYSPANYTIQLAMSPSAAGADTSAYSGLQYEMTTCKLSWGLVNQDICLYRDAANVFAQRNGTTGQTFRLYNTYTDASNYERVNFGWAANVFSIAPTAAGTGTTRVIHLSGLPTSNPGAGILWNNAGTPAIGT